MSITKRKLHLLQKKAKQTKGVGGLFVAYQDYKTKEYYAHKEEKKYQTLNQLKADHNVSSEDNVIIVTFY